MNQLFVRLLASQLFVRSFQIFRLQFLLILFLSLSQLTLGQTTYTWNQTGTASFTTATNWTPTRTTPAINDVLLFNNGALNTVTDVPTQTIGQLFISGNTTASLQPAASGNTLTIGGGVGHDLSIASLSGLNLNSSSVMHIRVSSGATGSISGYITFSAAAHTLDATDAGAITFSFPGVFTANTGFTGNAFTASGTPNAIIFSNGSTYVHYSGASPFGLAQPASKVVFQSGSLVMQKTSSGFSASGRTYGNVEIDISGTLTATGASAFVIDHLTVSAGTFNNNVTGNPGHAIKGNIVVASGATLNFSPASPATFNFSGSTLQTVTNSGVLTFASNLSIVVANNFGLRFNGNQTISGAVTINSGALLSTSGALTISGMKAFNGSFQLNEGGSITSAPTYGASSSLIYAGTSSQTTSANEFPVSSGPNTLVINNSAGVVLSFNRTVSQLQFSNGRLFLGANNLEVTTITGATSTRYIVTNGSGNLIRNAPAASNTIFPVGSLTSSYDPVVLNPTSSSSFSVRVKEADMAGEFDGIINNFALVAHRQWDISPSGTPGSTVVSLTDGGATFSPSSPYVIGHYTGSVWEEIPAAYSANTWTATVGLFSPFGAGEEGGFFVCVPPVVTCPGNSTVCIEDASFAISGGSPSGGVYSGPGVSGGNFDPVAAGPGTHVITYTYNDGMCENSCTFNITVTAVARNTTTLEYFCSIQNAIDDANTLAGHEILVLGNVTEGLVTIDKALTLNGGGFTLNSTSGIWGIVADVPGVTIENITVSGAGTFGIISECGSDNFMVSNATVTNCGGTGFAINGVDNVTLTDLTSTNNGGNGISFTDCTNVTLTNFTSSGNMFGGGFSAGIGIFSGGSCSPPAGVSNLAIGGTVSISEPVPAYEQILGGGGTITGLTLPAFITHFAGIGNGVSPVQKYYMTSLANAYTTAASLIAAPSSVPVALVYVEEISSGNHYVNDDVAPAPPQVGIYDLQIQAAINHLVPGNSVFVDPGTYAELVTVNKSLDLIGANEDVNCASGRGSESIIAGTGSSTSKAVTIEADDVVVNGFTITNTNGSFGVYMRGYDNVDILYNIITDVGNNTTGSTPSYGVAIEMGATDHMDNVDVSYNCISDIRGGENTSLTGDPAKNNNGSAGAIGVGFSTAAFDITNLTITNNLIDDITACTQLFSNGGKGAYGVLINVGANTNPLYPGKADGALVQYNEITSLSGHWSHGIGLEGETPGAMVLNNIVDDLADTKGNTDAIGVLLEQNPGAATVEINNNSFTNMPISLKNLMAPTVDAECNWHGTVNGNTIASKVNGNFMYSPWLTSGGDGAGRGFQPTGACDGEPLVITAATPSPELCTSPGWIEVTWTGGEGQFDISWTGGSDVNVVSPYPINLLSAGVYGITITDANGTTATTTAEVLYLPVTNTSLSTHHATIQDAIDNAATGNSISICAGTYKENVIVDEEVTLTGAGQGVTIVNPAISGPVCSPGSICPGGSYVFLVRANNVTIEQLTVDGDNPMLTSGVVTMGADLDARNGIITDHTMGTWQNLDVNHVTVLNIYLRGIYASSGGTFSFSDNTVSNVQGEVQSIAMMNFGGSGSFTDNTVSNCNDGIVSNWSSGTTYTGNMVSLCNSGIHSDNNSAGVADVISGNTVTQGNANSYGIFVFNPYHNVQVTNNTVTDVNVGLACTGSLSASPTITFSGNTVDAQSRASSTGMHPTNQVWGYGSGNADILFSNNFITNTTDDAFYVESTATYTLNFTANNNSITANANGVTFDGAGTVNENFQCNWWGSALESAVSTAAASSTNYTPWLTNGMDDLPGTPGFQPVSGSCNGSPVVITSAVASPEICTGPGSIEVSWTGGVSPFDIDWTPAGSEDDVVLSSYTITGLTAGVYTITVTDDVGNSSTTTAEVLYLPVTNTSTNSHYATIQAALNAAGSGNTIVACTGTYSENLTINTSVSLTGSGNGSNPATNTVLQPAVSCTGVGINISANNVTVSNMYVTGFQDAVQINGVDEPTLDDMALIDYCRYGISLAGSLNTDVEITNTDIQRLSPLAGTVGMRAGTANGVDGLIMDNCTIIGNNPHGIFVAQAGTPVAFTDITIQNSTISNNLQKGMYFEKLNNALLENLTMDNNGTDAMYAFNNGIDINLKYDDYTNITISNCDITNSGYTGTATDPENPAAVTIKARDDADSYDDNPATLTGVVINNNRITAPQNGLRLGEFGKINNTPTDITIQNNDFSFAYAHKAIISRINGDAELICNWHGTTDLATILADFVTAGSGSLTLTSILDDGNDGSAAVGFQPTGACTCPNGNLVTNDNTSETFCTIQAAIDDDDTDDGHMLIVGPGTYIENIYLYKRLDIRGHNYGVDPNVGPRIAESIILPAISDPDPFSATSSIMFYMDAAASGSSIDGFLFDGDNSALTSTVVINGADIDASQCITGYEGTGNLSIRHNILQNVSYAAIQMYNYYNGGGVTSNNYITNNQIDNVAQSPYGIGVLIYNNFYAEIEDNVMTRVRVGVQTGNFYQTNTGPTQSISNNDIEAERRGIFHNLTYNTASTFEIHNNTIGVSGASTTLLGISLSSIQGAVDVDVQNNNISGAYAGVDFWNCPSTTTTTVQGGTITGCQYGVVASNYDGYNSDATSSAVAISGVSITGSTIAGVHVKDNPLNSNNATIQLTIEGDCEIEGTGQLLTGILVTGPDATAIIQNNDASIHGFAIGIDVDGGTATVTNNHIYDNGIGVRFTNNGNGTVNNENDFDGGADPDNGTDIQLTPTADATNIILTPDNSFAGNNFGVENQTTVLVDATFNYWEAASGPGPVGPGSGAPITTYVDYCPWLDAAPPAGMAVTTLPVLNFDTGETFCSIQDAIDDAETLAGHTIIVSPGTYHENVIVNKQGLTLISTGGKAVTTIVGSSAGPGNGTVYLPTGINNVTIGQSGQGFTIIGFDGPGAIEKGAVYLQGAHTNILVEGNEIRANGEHGFVAEYNASIDGITINDNMFTGQTFVGAEPGGCGFATQFDPGNNVPRQLAVMGGGAGVTNSMNVTFTNNMITGVAGGFNSGGGCEQGNHLVTIDVIGAEIRHNTFNGTTTRFAGSLRARGQSTSVSCNYFHSDGLGTSTTHIFFGSSNPFNGSAAPNTLAGVASGNAFPDEGAYLTPNHANTWVIFLNTTQANFANQGGQTAVAAAETLSCPVLNDDTGELFPTIQAAINDPDTEDGHTIIVPAGDYYETVVVTKELTILGPNDMVDPCTGVRGPEAVIIPPTSQPFYDGTTEVRLMQIEADNVTIKGFTFDGDNPALLNSDGGPIDAADGVDIYSDVENILVQNNIFRNLNEGGVTGYPSGGTALTNNSIINNQFDNLPGDPGTGYPFSGYGIAVLIYNDFYADVENNCMTDVRIGVQTGNYYVPDPANSRTIANNTIDFGVVGIWHNLLYQNASTFDITNNDLSTTNNVNSSGLFISSIQTAVGVNASGNDIDGAFAGIELWNNPTTSTVVVSGGSVSDCVYGVFANNYDGYASDAASSTVGISGVTVTGSTTAGVYVKDNVANSNNATITLNVDNNCSIQGTAQTLTGILVEGEDAHANVTNNLLSIHGFQYGINVDGGSATVTNNHIYDNEVGVRFVNSGSGDVNTNNFDGGANPDNGTDILSEADAGVVSATPNNNLAGNTAGVTNLSATSIDATLNYWESPSGPGPVGPGAGVAVSTNVEYCPWLNDVPAAFGGSPMTTYPFKNIDTNEEFCTLQDALADAQTLDGHTIEVQPGDYTEVGQIVISKNITVTGTGADCGDVIFRPDMNTGTGGDARGWWLVQPDKILNLNRVTLDGDGFLVWQAIRSRGSGAYDEVCFKNIAYQVSGSPYQGTALAAFGSNPTTNEVTNSTFDNIGRVGVLYFGENVSGVFDDNVYTGKGAGDWLDYALDISAGAYVTVTNNEVHGNTGVAVSDGSVSAAVLVSTYFGAGTEADIFSNDLTGNYIAVAVGFDGADASDVEAHQNNFANNPGGGVTNSNSSNIVDATLNYWGDLDDSGPSTVGLGTGVPVDAGVIYCPWLDDAPPAGIPVAIPAASITITENSGTTPDDGVICNGDMVTLDATHAEAIGYEWSTSEMTASIMVAPAVTTMYSVTVSYPGGCSDVAMDTITVNDLPVMSCPANQDVCNSTAPFMLTGATPLGGTYSGDGVTANEFDPVAAGLGPHLITYTYTDGNNCTNTCTFTITVFEAATVNAGPDQEICEDDVVNLNGNFGGSATSASWSNNGGDGSFGDPNNPVTTYTHGPNDLIAGTVTLTLTTDDPTGPCPAVMDDVVITINENPECIITGAIGPLCLSSEYVYSAPAGLDYNWSISGAGGSITSDPSMQSITVTTSAVNPSSFTLALTVTDVNDCSSTCDVMVTVEDNTAPLIDCPDDVTVTTSDDGTGDFTTTVDFEPPVITESCPYTLVAWVDGSPIDTATHLFEVGETVVTWVVTDNAGFSASCTHTVTVIDTESPDMTVRLVNPDYDCETNTYCVDVEFQAEEPNLQIFGMNVRFFYDNAQLEFQSFADFETGYFVQGIPTVSQSGLTFGYNYFGFGVPGNGVADFVNGVIQLDPMATPIYISTSSWTRLYSICFTVEPAVGDPAAFCPPIVWDLRKDPMSGGFIPPSDGVFISIVDDIMVPSTLPTNEMVVQYNWDYDMTPGLPFGAPENTTCISLECVPEVVMEAQNGSAPCEGLDPSLNTAYIAWLTSNGGATADDACDDDLTWTNNAGTQTWSTGPGCPSITITFTVMNDCGNMDQTTATFTLTDDEEPTWITAPGALDETVLCSDAGALAAAQAMFPIAMDNCDADVTDIVKVAGAFVPGVACPQAGTYTNTWTVTDQCGNVSAVYTQVITVIDNVAPSISCPAPITIECDETPVPLITDPFDAIHPDWMTDRYEPNLFESVLFDSDNRLHIQIHPDQAAHNRGGQSSVFYATQGRQREVTGGGMTWRVSAELYVSADMLSGNNLRRTDLWTRTGLVGDETGANYPIIGIRRFDPADPFNTSASNISTVWRVWDPETGDWVNLAHPVPVVPGWHTLEIESTGGSYIFSIDGTAVYSDATVNGLPLTNVYLQAYNFGLSVGQPGQQYDVYWDNLYVESLPSTGVATATDNCDNTPLIAYTDDTSVSPMCPQEYVITRTWTATDDCGNSVSCTQMITVDDSILPTITSCPGNITIECDESTDPLVNLALGTATATDNCDGAPEITYQDATAAGSCPQEYTITRTWIATDACGNSTQCVQVITLEDTTAPTISCPAPITIECDEVPMPLIEDPFDAIHPDWVTDRYEPAAFESAVFDSDNRLHIAIDETGAAHNRPSGQQGLFYATQGRQRVVPGGGMQWEVSAEVYVSADMIAGNNLRRTDLWMRTGLIANETGANYPIIGIRRFDPNDAFNPAAPNIATVWRVWDSESASGWVDLAHPVPVVAGWHTLKVTGTGSSYIYYIDGVPVYSDATVNGLPLTTVYLQAYNFGLSAGQPGQPYDVYWDNLSVQSLPSTGVATATDLCDPNPLVSYQDDISVSLLCPQEYVITRTWTATDDCGNSVSCTQVITVDDSILPTITACPGNITIECDESTDPMVNLALGTATATDNCDGAPAITYQDATAAGSCPQEYTITRTWIATDACGNSTQCVQVITLEDTTAPTISCPAPITIECDEVPMPLIEDPFDAIHPDWMTDRYEPNLFESLLFDTDNRLHIQIHPNQAAHNRGGQSSLFYATQGRQREVTGGGMEWEVSAELYVSADMISGNNLRRTDLWTRTGLIANEAGANYPIIGIRRFDPADAFNPSAPNIATTWRVWDPETGDWVNLVHPVPAMPGWHTLRIVGTGSSYIYYIDGIPVYSDATVNGLPLTNVYLQAYNFGLSVGQPGQQYDVYWDNLNVQSLPSTGVATATDLCDSNPLVSYQDDISVSVLCPQEYVITRTWTATDDCGNSASCTQVITVDDSTPPVCVTQNITITEVLDPETGMVVITPAMIDNGSYDNCGTVTLSVSPNILLCEDEGVNIVTLTVTDACGNFSNCTATVTLDCIDPCVTVNACVYLEGSTINPNGIPVYSLPMRTSLNDNLVLPGQAYEDPFFGGVNYSPAGQPYSGAPWNYPGTEGSLFDSGGNPMMGDAGYAATVVDWVLVSLREEADGDAVCMAAALLHNNGAVEFVEEFDCCDLDVYGEYYIVVEHHNHLIVMSHEPVPVNLVNSTLTYSFCNQQSYLDPVLELNFPGLYKRQKNILPGIYAMYGANGDQTGSANADTDINSGDRTYWEIQNGIFGQYLFGDYNMNADVNFADRNVWETNNTLFTSVPRD